MNTLYVGNTAKCGPRCGGPYADTRIGNLSVIEQLRLYDLAVFLRGGYSHLVIQDVGRVVQEPEPCPPSAHTTSSTTTVSS